jgi:hypothetical protein
MPKFMFVLVDDPSSFRDVSPADMQAVIEQYMAWTARIKAEKRFVGGEKLADEGGRRIRMSGGKPVVVDGPYAETREVVGGYYVIEARDYDDAVALASTCPHVRFGAYLDVRRIDEI